MSGTCSTQVIAVKCFRQLCGLRASVVSSGLVTVVGIVTRLLAGQSGVQSRQGQEIFIEIVQTGSGANPASSSVDPGVKGSGA
jgi:hypothetical protein